MELIGRRRVLGLRGDPVTTIAYLLGRVCPVTPPAASHATGAGDLPASGRSLVLVA